MRAVAALTALSCVLLAGCGGSDSETSTEPAAGATLEELWRAPGDDVAVIPGTENHEPGDVRVSFLVVDSEGAVVALPTAKVWVADALDAAPFLETEAKLERSAFPAVTRRTRHTSTSRASGYRARERSGSWRSRRAVRRRCRRSATSSS